MREWWHRLKGTLSRREALAEELRAEMDAQLEMEIEETLSRGMTPEEARVAARRAFGNRAQIQERAVEAWAFRELEILIQDFGYGARMLWRNPGVTAVAVVSLRLGMGASTAIFGIAHALMFRALPVRQPEELVVVRVDDPWHDTPNYGVPYTMFGAQETLAPFFAGIAGVGPVDRSNVIVRPKRAGDGPGFTDPQPVHFSMVSGNYFPLLGLQARLGRTFTADDDRRAGGHPVAVMRHRYWARRLGGTDRPDTGGERHGVHDHWRDARQLHGPLGGTADGCVGTRCDVGPGGAGAADPAMESRDDRAFEARRRSRTGAGGGPGAFPESARGDQRGEARFSGVCGIRAVSRHAGIDGGGIFAAARKIRAARGDSGGDRGAGASDRVRQRFEPAAGAQRGAEAGDRGARQQQ